MAAAAAKRTSMIVRSEIIALEKDLDEYKSKLGESDHRWVFGPNKWIVELDKKEVRADRMSLTYAKERHYKSIIRSLRDNQQSCQRRGNRERANQNLLAS